MNFIQWQKTKWGVAQDADEPKNETLAEHRKHCKAEKGDCPFEKKADKVDELNLFESHLKEKGEKENEKLKCHLEKCKKELKSRFPGVKFSFMPDGYGRYLVTYDDGPYKDDVKKVCKQYEAKKSRISREYDIFGLRPFDIRNRTMYRLLTSNDPAFIGARIAWDNILRSNEKRQTIIDMDVKYDDAASAVSKMISEGNGFKFGDKSSENKLVDMAVQIAKERREKYPRPSDIQSMPVSEQLLYY